MAVFSAELNAQMGRSPNESVLQSNIPDCVIVNGHEMDVSSNLVMIRRESDAAKHANLQVLDFRRLFSNKHENSVSHVLMLSNHF